MRNVILYFFTTLPYLSFGQVKPDYPPLNLPVAKNKIVYIATVHTRAPVSEANLFTTAQDWYVANLQTADNTLAVNNPSMGKLSGTGIVHEHTKEKQVNAGDLFFTIDITVADNVYEYAIHDICGFDNDGKFDYSDMYNEELYPPTKPKWPQAYRYVMLSQMNEKITQVISSLLRSMPQN